MIGWSIIGGRELVVFNMHYVLVVAAWVDAMLSGEEDVIQSLSRHILTYIFFIGFVATAPTIQVKPDEAWAGIVGREVDGAMMIRGRTHLERMKRLAEGIVLFGVELLAGDRAILHVVAYSASDG